MVFTNGVEDVWFLLMVWNMCGLLVMSRIVSKFYWKVTDTINGTSVQTLLIYKQYDTRRILT